MRVQLDTHTFLWFVEGDPQLSSNARQIIEAETTENWLSLASVWELAIKISIGKLSLGQPLPDYLTSQMEQNGILLLPITLPHVLRVLTLPLHHRDPFDRLIAAQSLTDGMLLISADGIFDAYGVQRLW